MITRQTRKLTGCCQFTLLLWVCFASSRQVSHVHVLIKSLLHPLQLLFESSVYFIQHAWSCGYSSIAVSDRADTVSASFKPSLLPTQCDCHWQCLPAATSNVICCCHKTASTTNSVYIFNKVFEFWHYSLIAGHHFNWACYYYPNAIINCDCVGKTSCTAFMHMYRTDKEQKLVITGIHKRNLANVRMPECWMEVHVLTDKQWEQNP